MKNKLGSETSTQLRSHHLPNFIRQPGKLPNYMKSTIGADARRERSKVSTKRQSPRTSPHNSTLYNSTKSCLTSGQERTLVRKSTTNVLCGSLQVARTTCSSTLKGSKFPDYLELNPGGAGSQGSSGLKVCPNSYCSFNGHLHALVPPFVSARRRALKAKRSVKVTCQSSNETPTAGGTEIIGREEPATTNGDQTRFYDEIVGYQVSKQSVDEESLNKDSLIASDNRDYVGLHNYSKKASPPALVPGMEADPACKNDSSSEGNQTPSTGPKTDDTTIRCNAMDGEETTTLIDGIKCKAIEYDKDSMEDECDQLENFNGASTKDLRNEPCPGDAELNSIEDERIIVHELNPRNTAMPETEEESSTRATAKHDKSNLESDDSRHINPRGLHLLPLEPDPGAEKVSLRYQELDARKNAEEWMVDYALKQAVTTSQRKVTLLVEAFERVLTTSKH